MSVDTQGEHTVQPFGFQSRTSFNARKDILKTRSKHFKVPPPPLNDAIWKRPPPDFRLQAFAPNPPKRNTREAMQPWRYADIGNPPERDDEKLEVLKLPDILLSASEPNFVTLTRPMRPGTAKREFVKKGIYPAGEYSNPKPHDFRGLIPLGQLGLPEFITETEKDPFNIKLELANRRTITGALHDIQNIRDCSGTMASIVRQPSKWDPKLHLPKKKWPHRPDEYTVSNQLLEITIIGNMIVTKVRSESGNPFTTTGKEKKQLLQEQLNENPHTLIRQFK